MCAQALIHKPSRLTAIAFFIFSLAAAAFVIVWIFFLNKGTLAIEGEAPFRISVAGKEKLCDVSPCAIKLSPRKYRIILQKESYYEDTQEIEVKRWKETKLAANFTFIPVVAEVQTRPPFLEKKNADDIVFLQKINEKHVLKMRKGNETVVTFDRPFKNPETIVAPAQDKVLIAEENNGNFSYYLVDVVKKSRRRLEMEDTATDVNWVGPYIVFATAENKVAPTSRRRVNEVASLRLGLENKIFALSPETGKRIILPAIDMENIIEQNQGVLLLFSTEKSARAEEKLTTTISEALEVAKKEVTGSQPAGQLPGTLFLTEFTVENGSSRTLASIPVQDGKMPKRLTLDPNEKKIYFEMGNKFFEVILKK